jgi:hypothetical protein
VVSSFAAGQILDLGDAAATATAGLDEVREALARGEERVAVHPSGATWVLAGGEDARFLRLEEQGIYQVRPPGDGEGRPLAVAVNVELGEADLASLDVEEVAASLAAGGAGEAEPRREGARAARLRLEDRERRQSLWRFLLLAAAGLLAVETLVSNRVSSAGGRRGLHAGS